MLKMRDVYSDSPRSFATQKGTDITMIKATQGTWYVNPKCDVDYQAAKKAGKQLGIYHYAEGGSPEKEAQYSYKNTKNYIGEAVVAVDWESGENRSWGDHNWIRRYVNEFHRLSGVWPLIYVQQSAINQVANCAKNCGLWVAWYASMSWASWKTPNANFSVKPWYTFTAWQFTGGDMDRSVVNVTREGWKKLAQCDNLQKKSASNKSSKPSPAERKSVWKKKSGTFTLGQALEIHKSPHIESEPIAKLKKGDTIKFDAMLQGPKRLWLRQPRANGTYGYIVARDKYNKPLGKIK